MEKFKKYICKMFDFTNQNISRHTTCSSLIILQPQYMVLKKLYKTFFFYAGGHETQNLNKKCRTIQVNLHNHIRQYFGGTIHLS